MFNAPREADVQQAFPDWAVRSYRGKGTFKATYEAEREGSVEALKLFFVPLPDTEDEDDQAALSNFLARFSREIRLLGECHTPCLVKLGSLAPTTVAIRGSTFIAYSEELVEGEPLKRLIDRNYRPSEEEVFALLRCLVGAITELWEKHRCVHRDIKPGNIMKRNSPEPEFVLLDLGVSFDADGTRLTAPGISPGTPLYRAPEMLEVDYADKLDARTDLYCAAVTAFEFACGEHPLAPFNVGSVEGRILNQPPARLESRRAGFSEQLCEIINRLNRKKTTLRGNLALVRKELGMV